MSPEFHSLLDWTVPTVENSQQLIRRTMVHALPISHVLTEVSTGNRTQ
jgi:hypothetical protein